MVAGEIMDAKNIPQWMLESKTDITEQNDEVGLIVAGYIGAFVKRGFTQQEMGSLMASAFLLPLDEVEKRVDAVLSLTDDKECGKRLCIFCVQSCGLFSADDTDPCEIIGIIKENYGAEAVIETLVNFTDLLQVWKNSDVRDLPENAENQKRSDYILGECASVFPKIN